MHAPKICRCSAIVPLIFILWSYSTRADLYPLVTVVDSSLAPASGNGDSMAPILSPDGRFVLFASVASDLVLNHNGSQAPGSVPRSLNVFLRDRLLGATTLASGNPSGAGGNGDSVPVALFPDGRQVLFESKASDLVADDANNAGDIFIRDMSSATTTVISVNQQGRPGNGFSHSASITPDGRWVAFVSSASDLVPGDTNGIADIFVRDLKNGVTVLASAGAQESRLERTLAASSSEAPEITPDGRYVAFISTATNLVPGVITAGEIYVRDLVNSTTHWASLGAREVLENAQGTLPNVACYNPVISADGKFVAFEASSFDAPDKAHPGIILRFNLESGLSDVISTNALAASVPYTETHNLEMTPDGGKVAYVANANGSLGTTTCIQIWAADTGSTMLASGDVENQVAANTMCTWPVLDSSGTWIAFLSSAMNLVTNPLAGEYHLYRRDLACGAIILLAADTNGVGVPLSPATVPRFSADGRLAAFESTASSLAPRDRNRQSDVFVRDLATGEIELISIHDPGLNTLTPNGRSRPSALGVSGDGRYVAFESEADNLVSNDTNTANDVFVRDWVAGTTILASVSPNGSSGNGASMSPSISADGRFVAFISLADNLVAGDTNQGPDVFLRDLIAGTTLRISRNPGNALLKTPSIPPEISRNGRFVLFPDQTIWSKEDLCLYDRLRGTSIAITTNRSLNSFPVGAMTPDGRFIATHTYDTANAVLVWDSQLAASVFTYSGQSIYRVHTISPDGRWIVYCPSGANRITAVDRMANTNFDIALRKADSSSGLHFSADSRFLTYAAMENSRSQVYLYDFQTSGNLLVSRSVDGSLPANGNSRGPCISSDGRFVIFRSDASNLVSDDNNGERDVFLYDRVSGAMILFDLGRQGNPAGKNRVIAPAFSGDGKTLVFQSWAADVAAQDFNQSGDLFIFKFIYASIAAESGLDQGVRLAWPSTPGRSYRVQYKHNLSDPEWHNLEGNIVHEGSQAFMVDSASGISHRFYLINSY